jgi:hypothetical protein
MKWKWVFWTILWIYTIAGFVYIIIKTYYRRKKYGVRRVHK